MLTRRSLFALAAIPALPADPPAPVAIFSKHFHWAPIPEMAAMAKDLGLDAIDLTVRQGGHVEPERVDQDLPRAQEQIRAAGLELAMITTDIRDLRTPFAEPVLRTAARLGITRYRWNNFTWKQGVPLPDQLDEIKPRVRELAAFNQELGLTAMYHNHSGSGRVGEAVWDLWMLVSDFSGDQVGMNFDVAHATIEGGLGGWGHSWELMREYVRGVAIKDFQWARNSKGDWAVRWMPLGEGMTPLKKFAGLVKQSGFRGPVQLHCEYPELGSAAHGAKTLDLPKAEVLSRIGRDLKVWREVMA